MVSDRVNGLQRTFSTVACRLRSSSDRFSIWLLTIHGTTKNPISAYSTTTATIAERQLTSFHERNHSEIEDMSLTPPMTDHEIRVRPHPPPCARSGRSPRGEACFLDGNVRRMFDRP